MKKLILILIIIAGSFGNLSAQQSENKYQWYKICSKSVEKNKNRDEFKLCNPNKYYAIKVLIRNSEINLYNVEVYHAGGNWQSIGVIKCLKSGKATESYDLDNNSKDLKKIIYTYDGSSKLIKKDSIIEIWGLRTID